MKYSSDTIWNRTSDRPIYSTAPRSPQNLRKIQLHSQPTELLITDACSFSLLRSSIFPSASCFHRLDPLKLSSPWLFVSWNTLPCSIIRFPKKCPVSIYPEDGVALFRKFR